MTEEEIQTMVNAIIEIAQDNGFVGEMAKAYLEQILDD